MSRLLYRLGAVKVALGLCFTVACSGAAQSPPAQLAATPESVLFEELPVVEAATLHAQTLKEAPASVTVVTREDIRRYGYRTLGEVLASVRGFYMTYDRTYHYAGVRGFALPGDYTTRLLVMLNGHYLTENVYSSNGFFGQDFDLDMDLVKRIEIVRGPSSALYGSNGIFATINIVTRSPVEAYRLRVTTETGSFGERKTMLSSGMNLGHGANLLVSASVFNNSGQSLYFPEFNSPGTNYGRAVGVDGERGYHTFANLIWRNWSFTAYMGSREKSVPTASYDTIFADRGNKIQDSRRFLEAAYSRDLVGDRKFRWRLYYDQYRYRARYDYADSSAGYGAAQLSSVLDQRDLTDGDWLGSQVAYDLPVPRIGTLTLGGELNADIRALQRYDQVSPTAIGFLNIDRPDVSYGIFAQQQWQIARDWVAYLGLRFDDSKNHAHFVSPRVAVIYQPSPKSAFKFLYGRAFRNPNAYENFYDDHVSQQANPKLGPEKASTFEFSAERKLGGHLEGLVTYYHYQLGDLIQGVTVANGMLLYQNVSSNRADGFETELSGRPVRWFETSGSLALQSAWDSGDNAHPPNSPTRIIKWRGALLLRKFEASAALNYLSSRETLSESVVGPVCLMDVTLSTVRLYPDFDVQVGVRNIFDRIYFDPIGFGMRQDSVRQDGRSLFLKLIWHTRN
jgi:outer membrane receptor for ferrienterochelin and colicins